MKLNKYVARGARILLLLLLLTTIPFLTLVSIDMIGLWTAKNDKQTQRRNIAIIDALVSQVEKSDYWNDTSVYKMYSIDADPACFRLLLVDIDHLQPTSEKTQPLDELSQLIAIRMSVNQSLLESMALWPSFQRARASEMFTPAQASALNACIAVTPFSGWCVRKFTKKIEASGKKFDDGLVHLEMIKKIEGAESGERKYCSTVPEIRLVDKAPQ